VKIKLSSEIEWQVQPHFRFPCEALISGFDSFVEQDQKTFKKLVITASLLDVCLH